MRTLWRSFECGVCPRYVRVVSVSVLLLALVDIAAVVLDSVLPEQAPALLSTSADTVHGAGHLRLMPVLCALISS